MSEHEPPPGAGEERRDHHLPPAPPPPVRPDDVPTGGVPSAPPPPPPSSTPPPPPAPPPPTDVRSMAPPSAEGAWHASPLRDPRRNAKLVGVTVVVAVAVITGAVVAVKALGGTSGSAAAPIANAPRATPSGDGTSPPGSAPAASPGGVLGARPASIRLTRNRGARVVFQASACDGVTGAWSGTERISGPAHGSIEFRWDFHGGTTAPLTADGKITFPQGAITFSGNHFSGSASNGISVSGNLNATAKLVGTSSKPAIAFVGRASTTESFLGITRTRSGGGGLSVPIRTGSAPGC